MILARKKWGPFLVLKRIKMLKVVSVKCIHWNLSIVLAPKCMTHSYNLLPSREEALGQGDSRVIWNKKTHVFAFNVLWQNFLKTYAWKFQYWIGLHRESLQHPWKWINSTEYNNLYVFRPVFFLLCSYIVMCELCLWEIKISVMWCQLFWKARNISLCSWGWLWVMVYAYVQEPIPSKLYIPTNLNSLNSQCFGLYTLLIRHWLANSRARRDLGRQTDTARLMGGGTVESGESWEMPASSRASRMCKKWGSKS